MQAIVRSKWPAPTATLMSVTNFKFTGPNTIHGPYAMSCHVGIKLQLAIATIIWRITELGLRTTEKNDGSRAWPTDGYRRSRTLIAVVVVVVVVIVDE